MTTKRYSAVRKESFDENDTVTKIKLRKWLLTATAKLLGLTCLDTGFVEKISRYVSGYSQQQPSSSV